MEAATPATDRETAGLAHVATASFLASRAAPSIGFWIALSGGVALARAGQRHGGRVGYGASIAAMLQTVAIIGPARFSVPLTQALSAPLLGVMEGRRRGTAAQIAACAAIRFVHSVVTVAFAIVILTGGVGAYTDSYDTIAERLGFMPSGTTAALVLTAVGIVVWTAFASVVQVVVYRRGMESWPGQARPLAPAAEEEGPDESAARRRFDPRAVALASGVAFVLLLSGTSWALLASVAVWLALAWLLARGDPSVVPAGVAFAVVIGGSVLAFTALGGLGIDQAARRGARAALLVLVATWLRSAAGSDGLREVSRRVLGRGSRVPTVGEAAVVMDQLGTGRQLGSAAREAAEALRGVRARPVPVLEAALGWVEAEAQRFRPVPPAAPAVLRARLADFLLVLIALSPVAVIAAV